MAELVVRWMDGWIHSYGTSEHCNKGKWNVQHDLQTKILLRNELLSEIEKFTASCFDKDSNLSLLHQDEGKERHR